MQIREATIEDVIGIIYVQATTWIEQYPNQEHGVSEEDLRRVDWQGKIPGWQHMIRSSDYSVIVAAEDQEIKGFAALNNAGSQTELYELYVLPKYQKQKIGGKLLRTIMSVTNGDVSLQVAAYNQDAIDFYKYHGFKLTGTRGAHLLPGGKHIPTVQMRYQIAPPAAPTEWVTRAELARRSGVRESTIKWYCEQGLINFKQAESGRRRYFDYEKCLQRLHDIDKLKSQGVSIPEIKRSLP